jgi:hypothetical protein
VPGDGSNSGVGVARWFPERHGDGRDRRRVDRLVGDDANDDVAEQALGQAREALGTDQLLPSRDRELGADRGGVGRLEGY